MANTNSVFESFMKSVAKLQQQQNLLNHAKANHSTDVNANLPNLKYEYSSVETTCLNHDKVSTMDMSHYFFPIFYASEKGPLGIWEKQIGLGHIKRRVEMEGGQRFHVLELVNTKMNLGTFIAAPKKEWMALHVSLPHLVIVMKSFRRNFSFEVQVLDNRGFLRRFNIATWFNASNLKKWPFLCQLPLKLEIGWNEIHLDLNDLLMRTYNTRYFETIRVVINANCRLRQIFFCSDKLISGELPIPSMKMFDNIRTVAPTFGALNHPNYTDAGPSHNPETPLLDPPLNPTSTRVEKDLRLIHIERFNELNKLKLKEPYRSYFKELLATSKKAADDNAEGQQQAVEQNNNLPESSSRVEYQVKSTSTSSTLSAVSMFPIPNGLSGPIALDQLLKGHQYL